MGQGKIPWYSHRLMHRKRVTCELHDSYFHLMTIKHAIPKIEWVIELLYNFVKTGTQLVLETRSWRQDVVEKASTQKKAGPPGLRLSSPGERERHNADGHKSGGQYIAVLFGHQLPLTCNLSNKVRGILLSLLCHRYDSVYICRCVEKLITTIQVEGMIY